MSFDSSLPLKERILKRRKQKKFRLITSVLLIISFIIAGIAAQNIYSKKTQTAMKNEISLVESQEKIIKLPAENAITNTQVQSVSTSKDNDKLKNKLESYISEFEGKFGIHYINLVDNDEFGINDADEFVAASTIKIPLNLYLYKKVTEGAINYNESIKYLKEDYEDGAGEIQYAEFGKNYSVKELSKLSIVCSDNVAANMLIRLVGLKNLKDYMKDLGGLVVSDNENISCPKDMALYMKLTYEFCNNTQIPGNELMGYFTNTEFSDRIPELLPKGLKVAHKIGNQIGYVHDVGIVFTDKPYVLAIMSKDVDEKEAYTAITNISKKVYDFVK